VKPDIPAAARPDTLVAMRPFRKKSRALTQAATARLSQGNVAAASGIIFGVLRPQGTSRPYTPEAISVFLGQSAGSAAGARNRSLAPRLGVRRIRRYRVIKSGYETVDSTGLWRGPFVIQIT
jgi:hypothetical protein